MAAGRAWVINLDADLELGGGERYTPTARVLAAMRPHAERFAAMALAPGDRRIEEGVDARGYVGCAFSPTPRAIEAWRRAGAVVPDHPSVEVLRRVSSRAFSASLGQTLPGAIFTRDLEEALAHVASPPPHGFRIKRAYGMAGRGHRVVTSVSEPDRAFLRAAIADGVQIEPNVVIVEEYGLHGVLDQGGGVTLGALTRQVSDAHGQWVESERIDNPAVHHVLIEEARRVAAALHDAGYFGPFGLDAFTHREGAEVRLRARSEINPRYSMGFFVGFGR